MHTPSPAPTLHSLLRSYTRLRMLAPPTVARYELVVRNLARFIAGETALPCDVRRDAIDLESLVGFRAWCLDRMRPVSVDARRKLTRKTG
jgi:hypothetical protein